MASTLVLCHTASQPEACHAKTPQPDHAGCQLNSRSAQAACLRDMRHLPPTFSSMVSSKTSWVLRASPMDSPIPLRVLNPFSMLSRCWSCLFLAVCQSCSRRGCGAESCTASLPSSSAATRAGTSLVVFG